MNIDSNKSVVIPSSRDFQKTIYDFMKRALEKGDFDAVLIPVKVPSGDSYSWILCQDISLVDDANPVAPIMPVQGAKALKSFTRKGEGELKVAVVMRPCEVRASIELTKLNQVHLDNIIIISYDCPGAIPYSDYLGNPQESEKQFQKILTGKHFNSDIVKPVCQICDQFSLPASDLHFSLLGSVDKSVLLISNSDKGRTILDNLKLQYIEDLSVWQNQITEIKEKRAQKRKDVFKEIQPLIDGFDNLQAFFANCIGCHNCQSACPICYCRQCYFDSEVAKNTREVVQNMAEKQGCISFPEDLIMFHVGRMSHMSLSCVSCGQCTDVCPVSIPVASLFSYVADNTQPAFEYVAGLGAGEALPLRDFKLSEIDSIDELVKSAESEEN